MSVAYQGPWLQDWLETGLGQAARREGPAGYKGEERTGDTASRDPAAAGVPGCWPGDDGELNVASITYAQTHCIYSITSI